MRPRETFSFYQAMESGGKSPDQEGENLGTSLTQSPNLASLLSIYAW